MGAADNLGKQFYVKLPTPPDDAARGFSEHAVGTRKGQSFAATHGRVMKFGSGGWAALGIGAKAWTGYHPTRQAAVDEMFRNRAAGA